MPQVCVHMCIYLLHYHCLNAQQEFLPLRKSRVLTFACMNQSVMVINWTRALCNVALLQADAKIEFHSKHTHTASSFMAGQKRSYCGPCVSHGRSKFSK